MPELDNANNDLLARLAGASATRSLRLTDIDIERGGDGRTVTAYATPFERLSEVRDKYGHYMERIARNAYARSINAGVAGLLVLYNHGQDLNGRPHAAFQMPIGVALEVKADGAGLLTRTRYIKSEVADMVLEGIREHAINDYSHRSDMMKSRQIGRTEGGLPIIEHSELRLREYGPTPIPMVTEGAHIVAVRSRAIAERLAGVDLEDLDSTTLEDLSAILDRITPGTPADGPASSTPPPDPPSSSADELSAENDRTAVDPALIARQRRRRSGL